ncbi:hypothetical protein Hanom_Chr13g01192061 [Helianthus anomalus]
MIWDVAETSLIHLKDLQKLKRLGYLQTELQTFPEILFFRLSLSCTSVKGCFMYLWCPNRVADVSGYLRHFVTAVWVQAIAGDCSGDVCNSCMKEIVPVTSATCVCRLQVEVVR